MLYGLYNSFVFVRRANEPRLWFSFLILLLLLLQIVDLMLTMEIHAPVVLSVVVNCKRPFPVTKHTHIYITRERERERERERKGQK